MGTRANISIYAQDFRNPKKFKRVAIMYNHWDGYIEGGLGEALQKALKGARGDRDIFKHLANMQADGWEGIQFTQRTHGDIEYHYKIYAGFMMHASDEKNVTLKVRCIYDNKTITLPI